MYKVTSVFLALLFVCSEMVFADHWGKPKINGAGPWDDNISASVFKGINHEMKGNGKVIVRQAGVANLIEYKGKVRAYFQWLPTKKELQLNFDHIAFMDFESGEWSKPKVIQMPFDDKPHKYPVDPTVVELANGSLRMYFTTVSKKRAFIGSALSRDGVNFSIEDGKRFEVKKADIRDCAVVYFNGIWHMISPTHKGNGKGFYGTSSDGIKFERQTDVRVKVSGDWLGNMVVKDEAVYFFGTGFVAKTQNFKEWKLLSKHRLQDPAVAYLSGDTLVLSTTNSR